MTQRHENDSDIQTDCTNIKTKANAGRARRKIWATVDCNKDLWSSSWREVRARHLRLDELVVVGHEMKA